MASIQLTECRISLASDLTKVVSLKARQFAVTEAVEAEIRSYSAGRRRLVRRAGRSRTAVVSAVMVDRDTYLDLAEMAGQAVLLRDTRSFRMFGMFPQIEAAEFAPYDSLETVSLTVSELTLSEVV